MRAQMTRQAAPEPLPRDRPTSGRPPSRLLILGFALLVIAPTLLAAAYFYGIAADRYAAEFRYAVLNGQPAPGRAGTPAPQRPAAAPARAWHGFLLQDYLRSPATFAAIEARLPIRRMLARDGGDAIRGYRLGLPPERQFAFWTEALDVRFDPVTGVTTVRVEAFRAQDALSIAETLIELLGEQADELTQRTDRDLLAYVDEEYKRAALRLRGALHAMEGFRKTNFAALQGVRASAGTPIEPRVTDQLTQTRAKLSALVAETPDSPEIAALTGQARDLAAKIAARNIPLAGPDVTPEARNRIAAMSRLQDEYRIALQSYIATLETRQQSRAEAMLRRVRLFVFSPPSLPGSPTAPLRWAEVSRIGMLAGSIWVIGQILLVSLWPSRWRSRPSRTRDLPPTSHAKTDICRPSTHAG